MVPWHKCYDEMINNKKYNLNDQEAFALWVISVVNENRGEVKDWLNEILVAAKNVYLSPVFDDAMDVDVAIQGLREKGLIGYNSSGSKMVH